MAKGQYREVRLTVTVVNRVMAPGRNTSKKAAGEALLFLYSIRGKALSPETQNALLATVT
jgi:hypothetical protein